MTDGIRIEQRGDDVLIWVKAVPGASRDAIAGVIGDRLKVRVSAPAEGGKANRAICKMLARTTGLRVRDVTIEGGHTHADKVVRLAGATIASVAELAG